MNEAQQKTDLEQASKSERDVHDVEEAERTIGDERVNNQGSARPVESVTQRQDDLDDVEPGVRCAGKADGSPLFAEEGEDWKGNEREENAHETQLRNGAQPPQLDAVPSIFTSAEGRHKTSQPCDAHAKPGDAQEKERIFQAEFQTCTAGDANLSNARMALKRHSRGARSRQTRFEPGWATRRVTSRSATENKRQPNGHTIPS